MPGSEIKTYQAACFQFHVERGEVARNLQTVRAGIRDAAAQGADLIVLPEMWTTSFLREAEDALIRASNEAENEILRLSGELGVMVVGSAPEVADGEFYNRARIFDQGQDLGAYRKIHMFSPNAEDRIMNPGFEPLIVDTRLGRIGVVLCYDLRFPELTRYYFHHGAQVMCIPAQWPETRADHWRTLIRARAIENQCFVVGCNRIGSESSLLRDGDSFIFPGESRIVDPMGDVLAASKGDDPLTTAEIKLRRCHSMQRIIPIHEDRQFQVYKDIWMPIWSQNDDKAAPVIPTIKRASPNPKA